MATHFDITKANDAKLGERRFYQIPWLVWNDYMVENTKINKIKNTINIGSPMIYLHEMLKDKKFSKPNGTLVIPCKSVYEVNHIVDYDKLIRMIKKKLKPPYKILVGYFDLDKIFNIRHKYKDCTFVTCGKRTDLNYTYRLYRYLRECQTTVNFYPGTSILYSLFLKKKTYYINNRYLIKTTKALIALTNSKLFTTKFNKSKYNSKVSLKISEIMEDDKISAECFKTEYDIDIFKLNKKIHYKKALVALGYNKKKTPKELREILGWNSIFKRILANCLLILINIRYMNVAKINKK